MPADPLERGKRLMTLAHCSGCHSTHDEHHQDVAGHYLAGGDRFPLPGNGAAFAAVIGPLGQVPALSFLQGRLTWPLIVQGMLTAVVLGALSPRGA